ncbi:hypothetical protein H0B56_02470 [Haloechinothrix sp. YIM 98757]|uniref:Uncharacterized protein n=1 Tax=Haloechinothrix aidingensis TaxID=2752311 RepID=A0A838A836_9PSEU|nr:hypothetical protein [Haloechinothrix aidingensis]MBA0124402.1 hypothetical protein [Haloechinothrix aidingensis]
MSSFDDACHLHPDPPTTPETAVSCERCGYPPGPHDDLYVVMVPDSGHAHATDPAQDGIRFAYACTPAHAHELIELGRCSWIDEQLWAEKVRRAAVLWPCGRLTVERFAQLAGLSPNQLSRALRWPAHHEPVNAHHIPGQRARSER